MIVKAITGKEKDLFNSVINHPLQAFEWGEFREKTGIKVIRKGFFEEDKLIKAFQMTIHPIPHTPWHIGYLPKGALPTVEEIDVLRTVAREEKCIFIQLEPNSINSAEARNKLRNLGLTPSIHPLFTKYTFILNLQQSEEELLKRMHPKTRYNIKIAQKHAVVVKEKFSENAFAAYLRLTQETTNRQGFYSHTLSYHKKMWETLSKKNKKNALTAHLFVAYLGKEILTTWIVFVFKDTLYYPYGASGRLHREAMASTLLMWNVILYGKKLGLKSFDMWGSLGYDPKIDDPWFGFHRFKAGFGPTLTEFVGSFDLVTNPLLYFFYKLTDRFRFLLLRAGR